MNIQKNKTRGNKWINGYEGFKYKLSAVLVTVLLASSVFKFPISAAATGGIQGTITNVPIAVNGELEKQDVYSISINNSIYLPLRATSELLGLGISWNQQKQAVYITTSVNSVIRTTHDMDTWKAGAKISAKASDATLFIDGKQIQLVDADGKPVSLVAFNGSIYLPIRAFGNYLDLKIAWDGANRQVNIDTQSANELPAGEKGDPEEKGEKGEAGPIGPSGATGPAGPQGEKGKTGATGPAGPQGEKGKTGATGPAGPQGEKGETGAMGPAGPQGEKGETGMTGPAGPQGEKGEAGATGPAGANTLPFSKSIVANRTLTATSEGTTIGWDTGTQTMNDFDYSPTGILIMHTGYYHITYHVNLAEPKNIGTRLTVNGAVRDMSVIPPTAGYARSSFSVTTVEYLSARSLVSLQLYGANEEVNLIEQGQGASLSILKLYTH
ncbi:stalk domain-containing protein [Paenibacillus senegalimassiliensis]|uniref:stalk domain-containing protein n=1 Tax=Paenibacillus senegalimassiliensis TaxID=1737426 RepID=UPI00073EEE59|nr:stalk domain-containing protein [Paenibacillus senegalimassiliensis]